METHTIVEYEVIEPVSNGRFFTRSLDEALDHYEKDYLVYEKHKTISRTSRFSQTQVVVVVRWNNNPEIKEMYYENDTA